MSDTEMNGGSGAPAATVVELRVATLRSPHLEEQKVHWELMEDGELVNMGEWQIPRDQEEAGPRAWEELVLHLATQKPQAESASGGSSIQESESVAS